MIKPFDINPINRIYGKAGAVVPVAVEEGGGGELPIIPMVNEYSFIFDNLSKLAVCIVAINYEGLDVENPENINVNALLNGSDENISNIHLADYEEITSENVSQLSELYGVDLTSYIGGLSIGWEITYTEDIAPLGNTMKLILDGHDTMQPTPLTEGGL